MIAVHHVELKLTRGHLEAIVAQNVVAFLNLDPLHAINVLVDHVAQGKRHVRLVRRVAKDLPSVQHDLTLLNGTARS